MKRNLILALALSSISACSSNSTVINSTQKKQYESDRERTVAIENKMASQQKLANEKANQTAKDTGCSDYALTSSKSYYQMAMKYYGTNPSSVSETPEQWAAMAAQACVSGYEAGLSGQPQSIIDRHLYSIQDNFIDPFQYKAVAGAMYWGYGRSMR